MATHGEYRPGFGFYDTARNGWIKDPAKLSEVRPGPEITDMQHREVAAWENHRQPFRRNPEIESMIRLHDSSRTEERTNYAQITPCLTPIHFAEYTTAPHNATSQAHTQQSH